ncbi:NAD(P)-dependent oxidoreductase [Phytoactinopolyspora alkaliphila]|uniref:NAD(P)-dependent oxidoreductase n=1 Tax=Phytoactinopolyspora alkaliphila TaxID=1783498 RepID=A0A6N9YGN3_9ACTN|nr:NAD(P)-binding domain-containing protein [Phytoactinopolyspora alkaliphila]NED94075.1 NAD(P)-dependent oxidoreductase [Phytoactinopolyspora alkaliphila]
MNMTTTADDEDRVPVTVLGLGPMGAALASAFLENGYPTTVWNRTASKAVALVEKGAVSAASVADAVRASQLVIVSVLDYAAARAIIEPVAADLQGKMLVNVTTDSPDRAREMAGWASGHGVEYLDGSIMTPTPTIGRPEAVFLYSGPEAVYEKSRPVLASLGGTATYVGADPGRAAAFDFALLDVFWTGMAGVVHAFALARTEGITAAELLPFGRGIIDLLGEVTAEVANDADRDHYPGDESTLVSNVTGMAHIITAAQDRGVDVSVLRSAVGVANGAIAAGHGEDNFGRLVEVLARSAARQGQDRPRTAA